MARARSSKATQLDHDKKITVFWPASRSFIYTQIVVVTVWLLQRRLSVETIIRWRGLAYPTKLFILCIFCYVYFSRSLFCDEIIFHELYIPRRSFWFFIIFLKLNWHALLNLLCHCRVVKISCVYSFHGGNRARKNNTTRVHLIVFLC